MINNILAPGESAATSARKQAQLSQEDFFELLTAQLTAQDPLKPMDSQDFLSQLSDLNGLQATAALTDTLTAVLQQQNFASGAALLGKLVRGNDVAGAEAIGMVSSVSMEGGQVQLLVNGSVVPLANVVEVVQPPPS
jgi:flagellar basal-body rod modification protein FlgD